MADYNMGPYRVRPRGEFDSTESYRYLDIVTYDGGSYININYDTIDGTACIGVLPTGQAQSELYWMCLATKGEKGDMADSYLPVEVVTDGQWDFDITDKIYIPDGSVTNINIYNTYSGCCGIIISPNELTLPTNSDYSIDYYYVTAGTNQYYMYSFIYGDTGVGYRYIWNRTVINQ